MTQFRPSSFQILPTIIKNLLIINVLIFCTQLTIDNPEHHYMEDIFGLHHVKSPLFEPWQIITHLFLHGSWTHLFFNMFSLWMFGSVLENLWGSKKFITFYFICGIGAALLQLTFVWFDNAAMLNQLVSLKESPGPIKIETYFDRYLVGNFKRADEIKNFYIKNADNSAALSQILDYINQCTAKLLSGVTIGASGAIAGVLAAFLYLFPNTDLYLYFFLPVKAKWLGIIYFGSELYFAITNAQNDNIAHWAHLGGALVGFLLVLTWRRNKSVFDQNI